MQFADRLEVLCDQGPFPAAGQIECAAVSVGGRYTREAVRAYAETEVTVQTLIDWPSGLGKPTVRQIEAVAAAKDGTHAVAVMAHPAHVIGRDDAAFRNDVMGLVIAAREVSREIAVDVVIDAAWLSGDVKHAAAMGLVVRESGGDALVVSTASLSADDGRQIMTAVCAAAESLRVKVVSPTASEKAIEAWLACGVDRVVVPSGILFG